MVAKNITKITVIDESEDSEETTEKKTTENSTEKKPVTKKVAAKKPAAKKKAATKTTAKKKPVTKKVAAKKPAAKKKAATKTTAKKKIAVAIKTPKEEIEEEIEKPQDIVSSAIAEAEAKKQEIPVPAEAEAVKAQTETEEVKINLKGEASVENTETAPLSPVQKAILEESQAKEEEEPILEQVAPSVEPVVPATPVDVNDNPLAQGMTEVNNVVDTSTKEEEDKEVEEIVKQKISASRSVKLYRKIAYFFILLTIVLIAIVSYYSFVKVTITLIPNQERISNNMIFDVYDNDAGMMETGNAITGIVKLKEIEHAITYEATGAEVIGKEAIGNVTIINNYTKNQPLVATTRLLSSDGKLFRLSDTVNVPAGGSVDVEIYADEPSQEMAIGPTTFSIPGLWAGLQDQIFAKSDEDIVYQQKVKKYIIQDDIDDSVRELKQSLLTEAKNQINEDYKEYGQIIYKIDENSIESEIDMEVGDEVDEFDASMVADVIVVAFDDDKSAELAKQKFVSSLLKNKELLSFDEDNIIYSLNNYDHIQGVATINATFEGKVSLKEDSDIVEIDKILGLNDKQLDAYLAGLPEIAGFEVNYFPSFIKRVPKLVDRIEINIKK